VGLIAGVTCGVADEVEVFVLELAGFDVLDAAMLVELAGLVVDTERLLEVLAEPVPAFW